MRVGKNVVYHMEGNFGGGKILQIYMVICQFAKVSPVKVFFHTVLNKTSDVLKSKIRKIMVMNCQFDNKLCNHYTNPSSFMPFTIDGGYTICLLKIHNL